MAALREVEVKRGQGQVVDVSLLEPMIGVLGPDAAVHRHTGKLPRRLGNRAENGAPRNAYRCADGKWMVMSGSTQRMAQRILAAIGRADLVRDPRYGGNAARIANVEALDGLIGDFVRQRTLDENLAHFGRHEVRYMTGQVVAVDGGVTAR